MSRWARTYTADELALFARYQPVRERVRPGDCVGGPECWVMVGPPSARGGGKIFCTKCLGNICDNPPDLLPL